MRIVGSGDKEIWWVRGYNGRVGQDGMGIGQLGRALGSRREGRGPSLRVLSLPFHSLLSKHTTAPWLSVPILLWIPKSNCKLLYIYRTMFFKHFYFSQTGAILMLNASPSLQGVMHSPLCDKCAEYNGGTISGKELWRKGKMLMHSSPSQHS